MAELALFRPAEALDAETQGSPNFIRHARDDLTVFGAGLDWDSPTWELRGVARVSGRGTAVIRVNWGHPLKKVRKHPSRATRRSTPATSTSSRPISATGTGSALS